MFKKFYDRLVSLDLGLWLIGLVMLALAIGSFTSGASEQSGLNEMPLLLWLKEAPLSYSWWLWLCVIFIAVLVLNTILCSIEALRSKGRKLAPQIMHLGFLFIVLAHLFSAYGGLKQPMQLPEGGHIVSPSGERVTLARISATPGPMGMLSAYSAEIRLGNGSTHTVSPNHPLFIEGFGMYLKEVGMAPGPVALFEIHREPGAIPALIGALLFTLGNLMLLYNRRGR